MAKRRSKVQAIRPDRWDLSDAEVARFAAEDNAIEAMGRRLDEARSLRAGRVINALGWAWCACCGARPVTCDTAKVSPVRSRVDVTCAACAPEARDFEALAAWRGVPKTHASTAEHYTTFAAAYGAKRLPLFEVERALVRMRPDAEQRALDVIAGRSGVLLSQDRAILVLDKDGSTLVVEAEAAIAKRRSEA